MTNQTISVETLINAPGEKVWELWTGEEHICKWNAASDEWHTTTATNDLNAGGKFSYRMEAKDGSMGFDFEGTYTKVEPNTLIEYSLDDGRKTSIIFDDQDEGTLVTETFEAEDSNSIEMQQQGWQAILNNFKKYAEDHVDTNS